MKRRSLSCCAALLCALLVISLLNSCSDDTTSAPDLGLDQALADQAVDRATLDHKAVDQAVDAGTVDASTADLAPSPDLGPPPGLPAKLTMFISMGDSLAVGYPASAGQAYRELLVTNDDTKYPKYKGLDLSSKFPGIKAINTAQIGATSTSLLTQVASLKGNPAGDTLVVISVGGNDFSGGIFNIVLDPKAAAALAKSVNANLAKVVTHFADKQLYPGKVMVLLFKVHDPTDGDGTIPAGATGLTGFCVMIQTLGAMVGPTVVKQLGVFNNALASFALANGWYVADNHAHFLGHGYHCKDTKNKHYDAKDPTLWFYTDCLHATDRGNHEMRRVLWKRITGN